MGTIEVFTAKKFAEFMKERKQKFLTDCKNNANRKYNTKEEVNSAESYFGRDNSFYRYGYYTYNHHTKMYTWSKKKPTNV